jgi:hypothetical protein
MIVSFVSGSTKVLNVGSSFENRFKALDMDICDLLSFGTMASEITGLGTYMEVMVILIPGDTNVSPEEHSIPNKAPI